MMEPAQLYIPQMSAPATIASPTFKQQPMSMSQSNGGIYFSQINEAAHLEVEILEKADAVMADVDVNDVVEEEMAIVVDVLTSLYLGATQAHGF